MAKRCPVCSSNDIFFFLGAEAGQIYECKACGYRGALIVESGGIGKDMKEDLGKLKRKLKK